MPMQPASPLSGASSMLDLAALRTSGTGEGNPMGLRTAMSNPEGSVSGSQVPNVRIETSASTGVISLVSGSGMASSSGPAGGSVDAQAPSAPTAPATASQSIPPDGSAELASGLSSGPVGASQGTTAAGGGGALSSTASVPNPSLLPRSLREPPQISGGLGIPFLSPEPAGVLAFRPGGLYLQEDRTSKPLAPDHMGYAYRVSSAGFGSDDPDMADMADIFLNNSDGDDDSPPKPAGVTVATSSAPAPPPASAAQGPAASDLAQGLADAEPPPPNQTPSGLAPTGVVSENHGLIAPQQTAEAPGQGAPGPLAMPLEITGQGAPRPPAVLSEAPGQEALGPLAVPLEASGQEAPGPPAVPSEATGQEAPKPLTLPPAPGQEAPRPPELLQEAAGAEASAAAVAGDSSAVVEAKVGTAQDGELPGPAGGGGDPAVVGAKERTLPVKDEALIVASAGHPENGSV